MTGFLAVAATAIVTYSVHSFVACVLALGANRVIRRPQDREVLWKVALLAPLVTAAAVVFASTVGDRGTFVDLADLARRVLPTSLPDRAVQVRVLKLGDSSAVIRSFTDPVTSAISATTLIVASLCCFCAALRLAYRRRRLSDAIAERRIVGELPAVGGGALTLSTAPLPSPLALGTREICLPIDVVTTFSDAHQRSLIAHETAHLERRDPAWFFLLDALAALSAFQPLVFLVLRSFRRDVELICDEEAVRRTSDRGSLIAALALLASPFDPDSSLRGAATAYDGSPLVRRAERIANLTPEGARGVRRWTVLIAASFIVFLCAAPVVSGSPRLADLPIDHGERMILLPGHGHQIMRVDEVVRTTVRGPTNVTTR
jgi:beta-lactamase regulating signal transducer with metallopeptidase domain